MNNTDKYLRDIASELKGIRKELQKQNETVIIDANLDSVRSTVLANKEKSKYNEPLF
ncbi:TPA: hypothetical protein RRN35_002344 [Staphylococcus argenteus]|nr:hypothetical protein [Staphylococcus argenteus]HDY9574707.1 hypothetical protein [Staphylococcus argenteus]